MPTVRLNFTNRALAALPTPERGRADYKDDGARAAPGLSLTVGTASRTFWYLGKVAGRTVRYRIGPFPSVAVDAARRRARELAAQAAAGIDPGEDRRESRRRGQTLAEALDVYIEHATTRAVRPARPTTIANYRRSVRLHFAPWLSRPLERIDGEAVDHWYRRASKASPTSANAAARIARAVLNHAGAEAKRRGRPAVANPFADLSLIEERAREALVESSELPAWFGAVAALRSATTRDYLTMLLFSGLRRREAAALTWDEVDPRRRTLTIPPERAKNGVALVLPLSTPLAELLERRRREAASGVPWVFPSASGTGPLAEPKRAVASIAERTGIVASPHALRRTFATVATWRAGVPELALKQLLNHRPPRRNVTATNYIRSLPLEELRPYMQAIADALLEGGRRSTSTAESFEQRSVR